MFAQKINGQKLLLLSGFHRAEGQDSRDGKRMRNNRKRWRERHGKFSWKVEIVLILDIRDQTKKVESSLSIRFSHMKVRLLKLHSLHVIP